MRARACLQCGACVHCVCACMRALRMPASCCVCVVRVIHASSAHACLQCARLCACILPACMLCACSARVCMLGADEPCVCYVGSARALFVRSLCVYVCVRACRADPLLAFIRADISGRLRVWRNKSEDQNGCTTLKPCIGEGVVSVRLHKALCCCSDAYILATFCTVLELNIPCTTVWQT